MEGSSIFSSYIIRHSSVLFLVFNEDLVCLEANRAGEKLLGNPVGRSLSSILIDHSSTFSLDEIEFNTGKKYLQNIHGDNREPISLLISYYRDNGKIIIFGEYDTDEMMMLEKKLLGINRDLNDLGRELQRNKVKLQVLNDKKNELLGMAAHDMRSPAANIFSLADFVLSEGDNLSDEQTYFLKLIQELSDNMLFLVNDLLDYSSIESGKLVLDLEESDIYEIIKDSVYINNLNAVKKNIHISTFYADLMPAVKIDVKRVKQVLDNIIGNAIKFSEHNTEIKINCFFDDERLHIAIEDEGPGIPENEIEEIFKPFKKTSVKSSAGEKRTGLGLAIVKKIMEAHKGKVYIRSSVGVGTTVELLFPLQGVQNDR